MDTAAPILLGRSSIDHDCQKRKQKNLSIGRLAGYSGALDKNITLSHPSLTTPKSGGRMSYSDVLLKAGVSKLF